MIRLLVGAIGSAIAATALIASASAAKPEFPAATIHCGDTTYTAAVNPNGNGNNDFTPAHLDGGGVLIPVAFTNQHSTFTDTEGNVFEEDPPDVSHPIRPNKELLSCHFEVTFEDDTGSGTFSGDVTAFLAGHG